ncbi:heavy metal-associated isoprenylated plant protein 27 isoform X2 [Cryptomeria japonica]|uniref:heavy metal-associated isoprenylated plant protein 27 isoform X2 n=1 Tax=Cryptomeria japonica TaxID=3369 RepID=UPI0025AC716F|nr:heavy metal-associated isoprenylated plant protein 27 isoform X2 [Cryptomeria japonica]
MGVMALLESLKEAAATIRRPKKLKQFQTVELRVRMDCEGCERIVRKSVENMKGVTSVEVDRKQFKVTVTGYVDANKVLKRVRRKTGKKAEMWPYKPYNLVSQPYAPQVYDKKAPAGYVRNAEPTFPNPDKTEEKYTHVFSDDNPHACSIM